MAWEIITVCLDPVDRREIDVALAAAMRPYDRDAPQHPDDEWGGRWDRYRIGWSARIPVVGGYEDDPRLVRGDSSEVMGRGYCDGGPRALLDLGAVRTAAAEAAGREWDEWQQMAAAFPPARPLVHFVESSAEPHDYFGRKAWQAYHSQPLLAAVANRYGFTTAPFQRIRNRGDDPVVSFGLSRVEFMALRAREALATDGLLTLSGEWLDPDLMGSSAPGLAGQLDNLRLRRDYRHFTDLYLMELPPDAMLLHVHIHC
ncbi:hypothetical protein F6X68_14485 [Micromonospora sp. AMSO12t]|uniref:hypothetical protein n=1 Tax=Micromonospora sp. AMSO12t TaxID=2650410 RepID=UPI00124B241B|nr:hypothetical protein [Micromonospora sp. AMSO12t]KAB1153335.1 hypothetical protein F6X68_14485 [Micromonospora sp. AMSO12t]